MAPSSRVNISVEEPMVIYGPCSTMHSDHQRPCGHCSLAVVHRLCHRIATVNEGDIYKYRTQETTAVKHEVFDQVFEFISRCEGCGRVSGSGNTTLRATAGAVSGSNLPFLGRFEACPPINSNSNGKKAKGGCTEM